MFKNKNNDKKHPNKTCPEDMGNTENSTYHPENDKTLLSLEDQFFDIEITKNRFTAYEKKNSGNKRNGKFKEYNMKDIENFHFGYPVLIASFQYHDKRAVFSFNEKNYNALKDLMIKMGYYDPTKVVKTEPIDRNAALKGVINNTISFLKKLR